jgi:hypothetical protein
MYDTSSKIVIQWLFEEDSAALAALVPPPGYAILEYDNTIYPALHNGTIKDWCVNPGETLPLLKTAITLSADKPTFDGDGVDVCTITATNIDADSTLQIWTADGVSFDVPLTVGAPTYAFTTTMLGTYTLMLTIESLNSAAMITVEAQ